MAETDDRELLELAAKAAGLDGLTWRNGSACFYYDDPETGREEWNPLCRDGQALRLGVKLKMGLHYESQFFSDRVERIVEVYHSHEDDKCQCVTEGYTDDPFAATRRAITRAAASIGKERTHG